MQKCHKCAEEFQPNDTKHHCRACGEGFCDSCSSKTRPVPERGWGLAPVRVCDACFHNREISTGKISPASVLMVYWTRCFTAGECLILVYANVSPVPELLDAALEEEGGTLIARKVGEAVQNTLGAVVGAIDIPLGENYNPELIWQQNSVSNCLWPQAVVQTTGWTHFYEKTIFQILL